MTTFSPKSMKISKIYFLLEGMETPTCEHKWVPIRKQLVSPRGWDCVCQKCAAREILKNRPGSKKERLEKLELLVEYLMLRDKN